MTRHRADRPDAILSFIEAYIEDHGYSPSIREMQVAAGLASTSAVHHHLRLLAKAGRITYLPSTARTVRIVRDDAA